MVFLIDTGSDVSLVPVSAHNGRVNRSDKLFLYAANDTQVKIFGTGRVTVDLSLRKIFSWNLYIAEIPHPIIGEDFLSHHRLVPFLHDSCLFDTLTGRRSRGFVKLTPLFGLSILDRFNLFSGILAEFPELTSSEPSTGPLVDNNQHHIITSGPPLAQRARRLAPERLAIAKRIILGLVKKRIFRPSKSPWASRIHMVIKKTGD